MDARNSSPFEMELSYVLMYNMTNSKFDKTPLDFLPQGALDRIITKSAILGAIRATQPEEADTKLINFILTKAKRIFATAVFIELSPRALRRAMFLFQKEGFDDTHLPIEKWSGEEMMKKQMTGVHHPFVVMERPVEDGDEKVWTLRKIFDFQDHQGKFLAPVLSTTEPNHDLWDLTMPFVTKYASYAEGSFGVVSKYEIHDDHIKDPTRPVWKGLDIADARMVC